MAPSGIEHDRRGSAPGRRADDVQRSWKDYVMIAMNVAAIVWGAATLNASVTELRVEASTLTNHVEALSRDVSELRGGVNVLNCRTGITCPDVRGTQPTTH